jgi:diacylglycerol kinase family enzyme
MAFKDIILYNPYSQANKAKAMAEELKATLAEGCLILDLIEVSKDYSEFYKDYADYDRYIIIGGDGTIHRIANTLRENNLSLEKLYIYAKSGTCNDFVRSLRTNEKIISISKYFSYLPKVIVNNEQEKFFVNSAGLGLDAAACNAVEESTGKKSKFNFLKCSLTSMMKFKKSKTVDLNIDGKEITYKNVYMVTAFNGSYQGGGMNFAPKAKRLEKRLHLCIIKRMPRFLIWIVFPLIYMGCASALLGMFFVIPFNDFVEVDFHKPTYLQLDGEVTKNVVTVKYLTSTDQLD